MIAAGISALALPFLALSRRQHNPADGKIEGAGGEPEPAPQAA